MVWDEYFMKMAYLVASKSKDNSTKIGAVTVKDKQILSTGYNGICRDVSDDLDCRLESPEKYFWFEHAERNACYSAAREGIRLKGATLYTQGYPCADCARGIIQSGIEEVVLHSLWEDAAINFFGETWAESQKRSDIMFYESNVKVRFFESALNLETLIKGRKYNI
jgi:dCMP deaminase